MSLIARIAGRDTVRSRRVVLALACMLWCGMTTAAFAAPRIVDLGPVTREGIKALTVNRYDEVAGAVPRPGSPGRAAVWTPNATGGMSRRLLPVVGDWIGSAATDINDAGTVVGYVTKADFTDRPVVWRADGMHRLSRHNGRARGINNAGDIVGEIEIAGAGHAVVWHRDGSISDLSARLGGVGS